MSKYFSTSETECHCGCGYNPVSSVLLDLLDDMREAVGQPLQLSCACRCPEHNAEVGGEWNSQHIYGTAADVIVPDGWTVDEIAEIAENLGADGVGRYYDDEFVHVDVRSGRSWDTYRW